MTFLIESIVACALFTLFVFLMSRDPVKTIFNYPPWVWPYIMADDRLAVVYIRGPKKKGVLDVKSYAQELITTAASDKNVKFDRFASNGVQHLMVNTSSIQFEILVMPK